jgi:serine/threonine protein kinase
MVGEVISRYRVLEKLGGGAMGVVYKVEVATPGRYVALRFLAEELSGDPQKLEHSQGEAEGGRRCIPNLVLPSAARKGFGPPEPLAEQRSSSTTDKQGLVEKSKERGTPGYDRLHENSRAFG